jgi:hypothetical protein
MGNGGVEMFRSGKHARTRTGSIYRRPALAFLTAFMMVTAGVAMADNLQNDVAVGGNDTIIAGGSTTITYRLVANAAPGGDITGCNVDATNPATVTVTVPAQVTATPTSFQFTSCGDGGAKQVAYSSLIEGDYAITVNISGGRTGALYNNQANFTLHVNAATPTNTAPTVAFTTTHSAANEGDTKTFTFAITDTSTDTHSFVTGFPDCGSEGTLVTASESIDNDNDTGTFQCLFPDGEIPAVASTVRVQIEDQGSLTSNIATTNVTVNNLAPSVVAGFTGAVDCRTNATLSIDPDDLGVNDSPWTINISWGDGNTEPGISRSNLDSFTVTHVYNLAGPYNATVSVVDKDGATGSDPTNSVTINQTYTVDFLPPFDDSTPSDLIVNKMKNGRVVPVKVTLYDECGLAPVTDPETDVTIKVSKTSGTGTGDPVEEYADAGESSAGTNEFRWSDDGFWIYNLDSKYLGLVVNNLYRIDVNVGSVKGTVDNWAVLQPVK